MLRNYQERAVYMAYDWFAHNSGNLCISMPTGSGKSHVIAALCQGIMQQFPASRIVMLTHVRELIEQNLNKLLLAWPEAPVAIYSAGLHKKDIAPITFAGIQSLRRHPELVGRVDLTIIDEAHLINNSNIGTYRKTLAAFHEVNPLMRVLGLTATPYRLGQGLIYGQENCIFNDAIEPVSIPELIAQGYLLPLRSKLAEKQINLKGVKKIGGDFSLKGLDERINTVDVNAAVIEEIISRGQDRKKWLIFCVGVAHAEAVRDALRAAGVCAETVTGATPSDERARILEDFRHGSLRAITNANVLTTGIDVPEIDMIAMLRATESPGLYVQMAGRGMRVAPGKTDCLFLDFVGVVRRHGPIIDVNPPRKKGEAAEQAQTKVCPRCDEVCKKSAKVCPACGLVFQSEPREIKPITHLYNDDIMAASYIDIRTVTSWRWRHGISKAGNPMLVVTYYTDRLPASGHWPKEYFPLNIRYRVTELQGVLDKSNSGVQVADILATHEIDKVVDLLNVSMPPDTITITKEKGKYYANVVSRQWNENREIYEPLILEDVEDVVHA